MMMMTMNGSSCDESMMSFASLVEGSSSTTMPMPLDDNQHPFFFSNANLQDSSPPPPPPLLTTTTTTTNNNHNYPYYSPQAQEAQDYLLGGPIKNEDLGLNLGRRTYFSTGDALAIDRLFANQSHYHHQLPPPRCQAEGCKADLSGAKHYHRRHKVCEFHSKAAAVVVAASAAGGLQQRFCQQCSKFHLLSEFDESKRSCRKRLADHNRRRRKPQYNNNCKDKNKQPPNCNKDTTAATTTTTTTTTTSHLRSLQGLYQSQGEEVVVPFFFSNGGRTEHSSQSSNVLHLGHFSTRSMFEG